MRDAYKALMAVGFSDYEARAYCALLTHSPSNGYQIAKQSGVPRAKIYETLERLVARGAAIRVETRGSEARLFAPTDPGALMDRMQKSMSAAFEKAQGALDRYQSDPRVVEVLWRVTSKQDLVARGRALTDDTKETLHVALWAEEFEALLTHLLDAAERKVKIALILYSRHKGFEKLRSLDVGATMHSRTKFEAVPLMGRQFVLVADRQRCITGSIFQNDNVEGVFTLNRGLVTNAVDLVNHEIYLERILQEVGEPVFEKYGKNLGRLQAFEAPPGNKEKKSRG